MHANRYLHRQCILYCVFGHTHKRPCTHINKWRTDRQTDSAAVTWNNVVAQSHWVFSWSIGSYSKDVRTTPPTIFTPPGQKAWFRFKPRPHAVTGVALSMFLNTLLNRYWLLMRGLTVSVGGLSPFLSRWLRACTPLTSPTSRRGTCTRTLCNYILLLCNIWFI